ncbi:MAG: gamma-glutamyltransferase [Candidatus Omnitrophota bacterium]
MNIRKNRFGLLIIALTLSAASANADLKPVYSRQGMAAGPEANAVHAGVEILRSGGNAFDAAAAIGFALAVTYPEAGNLGGGGFLTGLTADGRRIALDFREKAPLAAKRDMYLSATGVVVSGLSADSLLAVGVPGAVHGLLTMQKDYGTLPRAGILAPAIRLAEKGFSVSYVFAKSLAGEKTKKRLTKFDTTASVFYPNGEPLTFGDLFQQPDLAKTLRLIRDHGAEGFYQGETAQRLTGYMKKLGGIVSMEDLANYSCVYRDPIVFSYKGYELMTLPPPSSGGVVLAQILKLIEPLPLKAMRYHSAAYIHTIVEAERLAFADRNYYLGDPDFIDIPMEKLLSDEYINQRRELIPFLRAGDSQGTAHGGAESLETTHYAVVDAAGNAAAITYTLNGGYGVGAVVEGAGFLLNNEMDDFTAKPGAPNMYGLMEGEANAIAPGKRMLSSMTPLIVTKENQFAFTIGTPGGPTIITTNLQIFLNIVEFGMNIREAIDVRRFHHQWLPDKITHEKYAFSPETMDKLVEMGYKLDETNQLGFAAGIQRIDGVLAGYSDGRGDGLAEGY